MYVAHDRATVGLPTLAQWFFLAGAHRMTSVKIISSSSLLGRGSMLLLLVLVWRRAAASVDGKGQFGGPLMLMACGVAHHVECL